MQDHFYDAPQLGRVVEPRAVKEVERERLVARRHISKHTTLDLLVPQPIGHGRADPFRDRTALTLRAARARQASIPARRGEDKQRNPDQQCKDGPALGPRVRVRRA